MANHKYQILNRDTGKVFEHSGLVQRKFFTTIKAVTEFVSTNPGVTFSVHDSLGQELPHFFSDVPMYAIRHKMGKLWVPEDDENGSAMWSRYCGRIAIRFDRDKRGKTQLKQLKEYQRTKHKRLEEDLRDWRKKFKETRIPELEKPENWKMVDQFLREKTRGLDRFFRVPKEAGKWGLLYNYAGEMGLLVGRSGVSWFKTLNGLKQFATNDGKILKVEKYHTKMIVTQKRGFTVVRSTGHGEYELLPEVDLYL